MDLTNANVPQDYSGMMLNVLTALVEEFLILKKKFANAQKEQDGMDLDVLQLMFVKMEKYGMYLRLFVNALTILTGMVLFV